MQTSKERTKSITTQLETKTALNLKRLCNGLSAEYNLINRNSSLIRVVQLNSQRSKAISSQMRQKIVEENIDVLLLQEPYAYKCNIRGYGLDVVWLRDAQ